MKRCEDYQELISRMLDGDLSRDERDELAAHVKSCPDCAAVYVAFRSLSENLNADLAEPPASIHENVMAEIRRDQVRHRNSAHRSHRGWHYAMAAAACLVLIVAAGLNLPKLLTFRKAAVQAAPAEAPMMAAEYVKEAETETVFESAQKSAANSARDETSARADGLFAPEAPAEEPAVAEEVPAQSAAEREPAEDTGVNYRYGGFDSGALFLSEEQSEALLERMSSERVSLESSPEQELTLVLIQDGELRELKILIAGKQAVYVLADGDSFARIDASPAELLELLGLDP